MAVEIERKFLVRDERWREGAGEPVVYRQGYLTQGGAGSVRVRIGDGRAHLNIKSATLGIWRREFEYEIPVADAEEMLRHLRSGSIVEKRRYHVPHAGHVWELDVFEGDNAGLVVAEIELSDEHERFEAPPWLGEEVSDDPRYYNVRLAEQPYRDWR